MINLIEKINNKIDRLQKDKEKIEQAIECLKFIGIYENDRYKDITNLEKKKGIIEKKLKELT